ncbi:hypothetical protein DPMN_191110 [Dreissena polymorpha]|uniref:EGF-like domain-containing protein n=1 Tax=Dreissena polymorpha TaxID=45954 RepID=A0A9D4BBR4_DREPO|nr:hypothetical protein DPMN_191110 [Dreissena polymorpha]
MFTISTITENTNECLIYQFLCENGRCIIDTNTEGFLCECGVGYTYNAISKRCDGTLRKFKCLDRTYFL